MTNTATTPSPTYIRQQALQLLIDHIEQEKYLIRDLNSTLEYLYRLHHGGDMSPYENMHIVRENTQRLTRNEDFLYLKNPASGIAPYMSTEAAQWAGLDRKDPYLDMPRFPQSTLLAHELHTWQTYANKTYLEHNSIGRRQLVNTLQRMPTHELGF